MNKRGRNILTLIALILIIIYSFPFIWQLITSLKSPAEIFAQPITLLPHELSFKNYHAVFNSGPPFHRYLINSAIIAGSSTTLCLIIGAFCAYALARLPVPHKNIILIALLAVAMFPQVALISPLFLIMRTLGLLNTHIGLILVYTAYGLPLTIWLLTHFFRDLPKEVEEAALIDGCTPAQVLYTIIAPLAFPGLFSAALLVFIYSWNEFIFALVFNTGMYMRTATVGISLFPGLYETPWGTIFAAATIVIIPLIILVFAFQRRIVSGLTAGAIK